MESIKTHVVVWLSGLITGLILMERWRRLGGASSSPEQGVGNTIDTVSPAAEVPADKPTWLKSVVAGATADAERARQLLGDVMPWAKN